MSTSKNSLALGGQRNKARSLTDTNLLLIITIVLL